MPYPRLPAEVRREFWRGVRAGVGVADAAAAVGVAVSQGYRWVSEAGGVCPRLTVVPAGARSRFLSFAEREEIAALRSAGQGVREIAGALGRSPATISRELVRNSGWTGYRASGAQARADQQARRPKVAKLADNPRLREHVQDQLQQKLSPAQIAGRLPMLFPDDLEMRVSHETIYQSLYVQSRGALKRDLTQHLRTGRALRRPRRKDGERQTRIPGMVNIAQRPAEAEDRAVPGHWEGDLITGAANKSAIGTLVERSTGFVLLLHLPGRHGALEVEQAMITAMAGLPDTLRRTLTWDQGSEMANHARIADATGLDVYFCDPHSPWQRGSNENTNGLLRQYFPKSTDLSVYPADYLAYVAAQLNNRPRKRHGFQTPAEVLDKLLSNPTDPASVAKTA